MSLVVNHNMMAAAVARNLDSHYGRLSRSVERLSTGLRVNSAADDAAGLAIRELQRADIAAMHQGARNANDAISMVQVADGALSIIDEKLIRMKELAEQAATGTYDATQRQMINEEFQAMASEIDRIAMATDFNGVHLLDGSLSGPHDGSGVSPSGAAKIHFGPGNDAAEDYYYVGIPACTVRSLFPPQAGVLWPEATVQGDRYVLEIRDKIANDWASGLDSYNIPSGIRNLRIEANASGFYHKPHVNLFTADGAQLTGYSPNATAPIALIGGGTATAAAWWNEFAGNGQGLVERGAGAEFVASPVFDDSHIITQAGQSVSLNGLTVRMLASQGETEDAEIMTVDEVTDNMVFIIGGHANNVCNKYDLTISCDLPYPSIETQEKAQSMLEDISVAITRKDGIRAQLGALQNRLENTVTNLNTQAENLQAAESRISDVDVATEMTTFVRQQILSQAAVAMLSQANSMPQMAMQLIGG